MSRHKRYARLEVRDPCQHYGPHFYSVLEIAEGGRFRISYTSPTLLDVFCNQCNELAASYHREPELERQKVKIDRSLINTVIKAKRYIGWVGYAHNPLTVSLVGKPLENKALDCFYNFFRQFGVTFDQEERDRIGKVLVWRIPSAHGMTLSEDAMMAAFDAIKKTVLWNYRGRKYLEDSGIRGMWFSQDYEVGGYVNEIVTCQTGQRCVSGWYGPDDFEPNYLDHVHTHCLYAIGSTGRTRHLVHPNDVIKE